MWEENEWLNEVGGNDEVVRWKTSSARNTAVELEVCVAGALVQAQQHWWILSHACEVRACVGRWAFGFASCPCLAFPCLPSIWALPESSLLYAANPSPEQVICGCGDVIEKLRGVLGLSWLGGDGRGFNR